MAKEKSASLLRLRIRKFRRLKRGYYSFLFLFGLYVISFFLPFIMGYRPIVVKYDGHYYFPAAASYVRDTFGIGRSRVYLASELGQQEVNGQPVFGEAEFRALQKQYKKQDEGNWLIMPPIPYGPTEQFLEADGVPPYPPSRAHWMGTDGSGRDVLVRLAYGYRVSISFALLVTIFGYTLGTLVGAFLGFYGGWLDILGLRFVEIWGSVPFLYTVIILASIFQPSFTLLVSILAAFGWLGIAYYIRGEFYREKNKDYVAAAIAVGESNWTIIRKHILPNALTPIIAFAPFAIVGMISALVSLDFLGFGLPVPTPSWGELLRQAKDGGMQAWHIVVFPLGALFLTLQLIVFIGEAVREAFDPKVFSRLR
ncbi:MAG: ABC transporter permease subunit [Pirellulaceae bacterium]|nr:ABC transporter permease subunit [Pirellulaceae bacterium]